MVFKNHVPRLQYHVFPTGTGLSCDQPLKVPNGVISIAFNADFLSQTVTANNLDHPDWNSNHLEPADATVSSLECRAQALFYIFLMLWHLGTSQTQGENTPPKTS